MRDTLYLALCCVSAKNVPFVDTVFGWCICDGNKSIDFYDIEYIRILMNIRDGIRIEAKCGWVTAGGIEAIRRGHKSPFYSIDYSHLLHV